MNFLFTILIVNVILVLNERFIAFSNAIKKLAGINALLRFFFIIPLTFFVSFFTISPVTAQPCTGGTPSYTVNLSGKNDSTWTSASVTRAGTCCATSNCVEFIIILDAASTGIQMDIISGAIPGGALNYKIGCGTALSFGQPICLTGTGPFRITFCKPGGNANIYQIKAIPKPVIKGHTVGSLSCGVYMKAQGFVTAGLTWSSVPFNATSNSYLSCLSNCDSVTVVPGPIAYPLSLRYRVCGSVIGGCMVASTCDTVTVKLVDDPAVNITPHNPTICYGASTITLTANPVGGVSPYHYTWNNGDTVKFKTVGAGTYRVAITDSLGCIVARDTSIVKVLSLPFVANAGADTNICSSLNSVNLHGVIQIATGGKWSGGSGRFIPDDTTMNAIYVPSQSEVIASGLNLILTSTGNSGCNPAKDTVHITINSAPLPSITGPLNLCEYTGGYAYSSPVVAGNNYDWHIVGGTIASGQGSAAISVNWSGAGPGYIYMIQTATSGCKGVGSLQTISRFDLNTNPITKASVGPDAITSDTDAYSNGFGYQITQNCGGTKGADIVIPGNVFDRGKMCMTFSFQRDENDADFFDRGGTRFYLSGGKLSIQMRTSNGLGGFTDVGPLITNYTVPNDDIFRYFTFCYDSASGVARVLVNDSIVWAYQAPVNRSLYWVGAGNAIMGTLMDGSCSGKTLIDFINIAIPVSIYPKPAPVISGPSPVCAYNIDYTYTVPADPITSTYLWSVIGGNIISGSGTNSVTVKWTISGTRSISLKQTYTATICDSIVTENVIVNPSPLPVISGYDSICAGKAYTYSVPAIAGNVYAWSVSTGGVIIGLASGNTVLIQYGSAGIGSVSVRQTNTFGCDSIVIKVINIFTQPVPVISGPATICQNRTYTHSIIAVAGQTYTWTVIGGTIQGSNNGNTVIVNWGAPGIGSLSLTQTIASGCDSTVTKSISISPAPSPVIIGVDSSCENTLATYTISPVTGNSYNWVASGGVIQGSVISNSVQVKWGLAGTGNISVTQTTSIGCDSSVSKSIIKKARPVPIISGTVVVCVNKTFSYSVANVLGNSYQWNVSGGILASPNNVNAISVKWQVAGSGTVSVLQTGNTGCDSLVILNIIVRPAPVPVINGSSSACALKTSNYNVAAISGSTYLWSATGGTISGTNTDTLCSVLWAIAGSGVVTVRQINSFGCDSIVSKNISINPLPAPLITGNATPCSKKTHNYSVNAVAGNSYLWTASGGVITGTTTTNLISVLWGPAGVGVVTVKQTNTFGCFITTFININILALPGPSTLYHY